MIERPKWIYRYNLQHKLEKHKIGPKCMPVLEQRYPELFRCRHGRGDGDYYGFSKLIDAETEAMRNITSDVTTLRVRLQEIGRLAGEREFKARAKAAKCLQSE